ncbi:hypothetical protein niasHT_038726 [Heterodera trifolii]|uniref:Integrase catalytic domain-containing protein n=1 Tax=Heterodera trifolii TaxID=157864 RepID=A0ABD2I3S2_9BILA
MANKFVLVPQEIYRGLTAATDTGDINLDAVRHDLTRTRAERTNPSAKNVRYNQQLRRYLQMRREVADKPARVELVKGLSVLMKQGGADDEEAQVVDTPPRPPRLPPPPPPPPPAQHPPRRPPSPPGSPPPRPQRPPRPPRAAPPSRRDGRMDEWRKRRYAIQQRQPVVRDLLAEAAAAPLPESDEDDDYMLESGFALPAPSQYYGDLPVLPDNADAIEEMDTAQHRIATRRKLHNDDDDLQHKKYRVYYPPPSSRLPPPRPQPKIEPPRPPPPRPTVKREPQPPLDPRPSTSRQAGYNPPAEPKHEKKPSKKPPPRAVPYRIPKREPKIVETLPRQQPPPAAAAVEIPPVPPPRRGTKRRYPVNGENDEVRIRKRVRQPTRVRVQYSPEPGPSTSAQSDEQQHRELFTIPSNQLTMTQRVERLYIKCNRYADRMGVRGNTINTANGKPLAHSNLRMAIRSGHIGRATSAGPNSVFMDGSTKETVAEHNHTDGTKNQEGISPEKMELINTTLDKLYNNPSSPAAFAGVTALWKEARKSIKHLRKKDVQHYLEGHRTYTLMRPRRVRFPRASTVAAGFMTDVQVDLADFQALSRHNRGHRYLLVAVDVLSKRLFVVPLKNKRAEEMLEAFKLLIGQMPMAPHRIFSDKGTEFKNRLLKEFFEEREIEKHEPVHSSVKASVAERAIRNVKQRLYRYFAETETLNWVDAAQKIVDGINSSPSRAHGMRPIDVGFSNAQRVWKRLYGGHGAPQKRRPPRFRKDDFVRMSREKGQFEKGYLPNYGDEILEVDEVMKRVRPIRYKLRDEHGEKFKGSFYEQELGRVRKDAETSYRIEKVYRKRELFAIPSNQLTMTQRIERLYIKCNHYAYRMGVRGNTINTANGKPLAHSNLRMTTRSGHIGRATSAGPNSVFMDGSTKETVTENNHQDGTENQEGISPEKMELINTTLDKLYNDPSSPAAFAGVTALWKEARKKLKHLRKKDVQHYLEGHRTYTLMRPRRVRFPRAKTVASGFMTDVQVDLADFQALSRHNRGHRYLLVAVDVLSKRLFVVPLKNKKAEEMLEAFKELVKQMPMVPHRIFSDKGTEFKNKLLKEFFEEQEIEKHEPVHSSVKASVAERAIRNVKQRLYRYFAERETLNWVDVVQQIVDGINSTPSRVHGMRPIDVNFENAQKVWKRIYESPQKRQKPRFHKDEFVRMSREKGQFEKGYLPNYGDEILEIDEVLKAVRPIRYKLRDDHGEKFRGTFYEQELARVRKDADTSYRIEKVYRKRKRTDGTTEMLVKFIGYPEREWIDESQIV